MDRRPAFDSCQIYLLLDKQGALSRASVDSVLRQPRGFGPAFDLPLTTIRSRPPRPSATALGYQPVGISPITLVFAGSFTASSSSALPPPSLSSSSLRTSSPSCITATALRPPLVTNSVCSSGESARLFGLAPRNPAGFAKIDAGAAAGISAKTSPSLASSTTTVSLLSTAMKRRERSLFKIIFVG